MKCYFNSNELKSVENTKKAIGEKYIDFKGNHRKELTIKN